MTQKRKNGPRKRANKPSGWVKRRPKMKGKNDLGLSKIEKAMDKKDIKILIKGKQHAH